jgi:hypothetical protein
MWFAASLLFKSTHPRNPEHEGLWEECLTLVRADSEEQVCHDAELIGKAREHEYVAANGDLVRWVFERLERISKVESLEHGSELFSRFLSRSEVESLSTPFED